MKPSYKIGLALATGLLMVVILVFAFPGKDQADDQHDDRSTPQTLAKDDGQGEGSSSPASRPSGFSDPSGSSDDDRSGASAWGGADTDDRQPQASTTPRSPVSNASNHPTDANSAKDIDETKDVDGTNATGPALMGRIRAQAKARRAANRRRNNNLANKQTPGRAQADPNPRPGQSPGPAPASNRSKPTAAGANPQTNTPPTGSPETNSRRSNTPSDPPDLASGSTGSGNGDSSGNTPTRGQDNPWSSTDQPTTSNRLDTADTGDSKQYPATHTVEKGENMARIAGKVYGNQKYWVEIAQANPTVDPQHLQIGQTLKMPSQQRIETSTRNPESDANSGSTSNANANADASNRPQPGPGGGVQYTVQEGDSLSSIAKQYYGKPTDWYIIFEANRDTLEDHPDEVREGEELFIPPAPNRAGQASK